MVDMHVGNDERLYGGQGELDIQPFCSGAPIARSLVTLKQAAIDQQAVGRIHV